jgi:hypothetical protein
LDQTGLLASTDTPGSTAPLVSRTIPLIALCALATVGASRRTDATNPPTTSDLPLATPCMALSLERRTTTRQPERYEKGRNLLVERWVKENFSAVTKAGSVPLVNYELFMQVISRQARSR